MFKLGTHLLAIRFYFQNLAPKAKTQGDFILFVLLFLTCSTELELMIIVVNVLRPECSLRWQTPVVPFAII